MKNSPAASESPLNVSQKYWFKAKRYGWGWVPVSWQGWLVILVYGVVVAGLFWIREEPIPNDPDSGSNFLTFALPLIIATILLVCVSYKKGEKPRFRWGS